MCSGGPRVVFQKLCPQWRAVRAVRGKLSVRFALYRHLPSREPASVTAADKPAPKR